MSRVEIVIPILKNCLDGHDIFKLNGIFCFLSLKLPRKYDVLERGFSKRLETKATLFGLLGRKDRRTKIGNLYSCSCGCKLRESKTDKAFTQLNIINILCKQKLKSRPMNIFERHVKLQANSWHS